MIARIGKLSLILGTILSILFTAAGFLVANSPGLSEYFDDAAIGRFAYFASMPFGAMLASHLAATLICVLTRKKDETAQKMPHSIGVLFKAYFYLWAFVSVAIVAGCFVFFDFQNYYLQQVFAQNAIALSLAWIATVILCTLVWATVCAWKATKIVGIIAAFVAFIVAVAGSVSMGFLYSVIADNYRHYDDSYHAYDYGNQTTTQQSNEYAEPSSQTPQSDNETVHDNNFSNDEYADRTELDRDRAFRFMKYRLELTNQQSAIDLVRNWEYYGWWKEDDFGDYDSRDHFHGERDFHRSKGDYYSLRLRSMRNSDALNTIVNYYTNTMQPRGRTLDRNSFQRSGAGDCVRILLWAYDDIYSKGNSADILRTIYGHMAQQHEYSGLIENYYELLQPYMSDDVISNIYRICSRNTDDVQWATGSLAIWAYSFWARRHHDNMDGTAYGILKIIERMYN